MFQRFANLNLEALYGIPAMCPVTNCQAQMSPLEMLAHLMMRHSPQDSMIEIAEDVPKQYEVDIDKLTPGRNHSIGVIAYEGAPKPGLSCAVTSDLQIVHHLPIILMLYVSPPILNTEQAYILYLVSAVPSSLVSANVTLLDGFHAHEKRGWRCLRNSLDSPLMDSQNRLYCNTDYLLYTATDIRELCLSGEQRRIFVKIVLHGEPDPFQVDA
uniref:MIP01511p n=1 Tax=Drosophila melanogaster TaxID=7227 RepID=C9QPD3_DROME|nr:MIP01511p [Drosophila melanogaster]